MGIAVYSLVIQDRTEQGAIPLRRSRAPGGGGSKPKVREWPWEVKGHRIHKLGDSHWRCEYCRKQAYTAKSLSTLAKRRCHGGLVLSLRDRNARSHLSKWRKRAAAARGPVPPGVPPPVTHEPERLEESWRCLLCGQEARTLGPMGFFCGAPMGPAAAPAQARVPPVGTEVRPAS